MQPSQRPVPFVECRAAPAGCAARPASPSRGQTSRAVAASEARVAAARAETFERTLAQSLGYCAMSENAGFPRHTQRLCSRPCVSRLRSRLFASSASRHSQASRRYKAAAARARTRRAQRPQAPPRERAPRARHCSPRSQRSVRCQVSRKCRTLACADPRKPRFGLTRPTSVASAPSPETAKISPATSSASQMPAPR